MTFRLQGSCFLLTYAQVTIDTEDASELLQQILPVLSVYGPIQSCRVGLERHQDGHPHIHVFVFYETRIDRRCSNQLDFFGTHPNIRPKRTRAERTTAYTYCAKDGVYADQGEFTQSLVPRQRGATNTNQDSQDLVAAITEHDTYPSWLQWCYSHGVPSGYCTELWRSVRIGTETLVATSELEGTIPHADLSGMHFDLELDRATVLVGPSGCGKTTWARREIPKPALFVRHSDDLRSFRVGYHVGIVFDDMCFNGDASGKGAWPRTSQIHLLDWYVGSSIHVRYSTVYIPAKVHKIFVGNYFMFTGNDEAINRRIHCIELE